MGHGHRTKPPNPGRYSRKSHERPMAADPATRRPSSASTAPADSEVSYTAGQTLAGRRPRGRIVPPPATTAERTVRSEEHTSELQSRGHLVCRPLLEKKKEPEGRETAQEDVQE